MVSGSSHLLLASRMAPESLTIGAESLRANAPETMTAIKIRMTAPSRNIGISVCIELHKSNTGNSISTCQCSSSCFLAMI